MCAAADDSTAWQGHSLTPYGQAVPDIGMDTAVEGRVPAAAAAAAVALQMSAVKVAVVASSGAAGHSGPLLSEYDVTGECEQLRLLHWHSAKDVAKHSLFAAWAVPLPFFELHACSLPFLNCTQGICMQKGCIEQCPCLPS